VIEITRLCPAESDQSVLHGGGITLPTRHSHRPLKKPPYHSDLARIHSLPGEKSKTACSQSMPVQFFLSKLFSGGDETPASLPGLILF